ncbi:uncharacterized protein FOMMEDRAFT_18358 [Fomitiporia mediterranea MF3/22]|uniref:uncharacterized protein n=1 Tax=Fomitiporia mediterranea (strain MF3/22) TaxID=694068 RepID=UPI000440957A|nr:uncharacterized protein FOMMEDRAFT_18358 [Fomitiporia mediterranea MF3/22]EJD06183.1 hypothetical protein FOMMEDRAFT_18358 [Fomitiporia mediterranea MF3/22]
MEREDTSYDVQYQSIRITDEEECSKGGILVKVLRYTGCTISFTPPRIGLRSDEQQHSARKFHGRMGTKQRGINPQNRVMMNRAATEWQTREK